MKVEIMIGEVTKLITRTKMDDGLTTTLQFDAKVPVHNIARILNLQRQGIPLIVTVTSPQAQMDLNIQEEKETDVNVFQLS